VGWTIKDLVLRSAFVFYIKKPSSFQHSVLCVPKLSLQLIFVQLAKYEATDVKGS